MGILGGVGIPGGLGRTLAIIALLLFSAYSLAETGAETYKMKCAACHGRTGAGDSVLGKNLRIRALGSAEVQQQSDEELTAIISKGKNKMPRFDHKLSRDQIADLVRYIRSLKK